MHILSDVCLDWLHCLHMMCKTCKYLRYLKYPHSNAVLHWYFGKDKFPLFFNGFPKSSTACISGTTTSILMRFPAYTVIINNAFKTMKQTQNFMFNFKLILPNCIAQMHQHQNIVKWSRMNINLLKVYFI